MNFLYRLIIFPVSWAKFKLLKRTRKHGLLAVPGQQGLFFDCETQKYVNYLDF
jgi:hypothetical protein